MFYVGESRTRHSTGDRSFVEICVVNSNILSLDIAGTPLRWIDIEAAACYYALGKVAWEVGGTWTVLRGGRNTLGITSELAIAPIIAVRSPMHSTGKMSHTARLSRRMLFARDRHAICSLAGW